MTIITTAELEHLPVYTVTGTFLGKVVEVEVDAESQIILRYHVRAGRLILTLVKNTKTLVIQRAQVVSVSEEKMIVDDAVVGTPAEEVAHSVRDEAPSPSPITSSLGE